MSTNTDPRVIGSMARIDDEHGLVRVEDVYDTDIDDLWDAVTDPARLARWLLEVDGEVRLGATVGARFTSRWEGTLRIDVCDAPHRVLVTAEPGTGEETVMEATLSAEGERTRLVVEERGLPIAALPFHGAGWQAHLEDLARHLAGADSEWSARWTALTPTYQALSVA
jgi:uncharacterized protein YndB with AHSA1/START domain